MVCYSLGKDVTAEFDLVGYQHARNEAKQAQR